MYLIRAGIYDVTIDESNRARPKGDLGRLTLEKAAPLKSFWKTSIASIVRRAFTLKLKKISDRQYRYLNMQIAKFGFKRVEPIPIPLEEPQLFNAIMEVHRNQHRHSDIEMADRLGMFIEDFRDQFGSSSGGLRIFA